MDRVLRILNVVVGVSIFVIAILMVMVFSGIGPDEILGIKWSYLLIALLLCILVAVTGRTVAWFIRWLPEIWEDINEIWGHIKK